MVVKRLKEGKRVTINKLNVYMNQSCSSICDIFYEVFSLLRKKKINKEQLNQMTCAVEYFNPLNLLTSRERKGASKYDLLSYKTWSPLMYNSGFVLTIFVMSLNAPS